MKVDTFIKSFRWMKSASFCVYESDFPKTALHEKPLTCWQVSYRYGSMALKSVEFVYPCVLLYVGRSYTDGERR